MFYWYVYFGIAAVLWLLLVVVEYHERLDYDPEFVIRVKPAPDEWQDPALQAPESPVVTRLVEVIVLLLLSLVWPVAVCLKLADIRQTRRNKRAKRFPVQRSWLRQRLTIEQVEQQETVADPLGAAPALPFGFFNQAWLNFVAALRKEDELWRFEAPERLSGVYSNMLRGYVIVRRRQPEDFFVTQYR